MSKENIIKLNYRTLGLEIDIEARPGVYVPDQDSACGKTYLLSIIRSAPDLYSDMVAYSYNDKRSGFSLYGMLEARETEPKFILLDRYDLMQGEFLDIMAKYKDKAIIIVDTKEYIYGCSDAGFNPHYIPFEYKKVDEDTRKIEVVQNDLYIRRQAVS